MGSKKSDSFFAFAFSIVGNTNLSNTGDQLLICQNMWHFLM